MVAIRNDRFAEYRRHSAALDRRLDEIVARMEDILRRDRWRRRLLLLATLLYVLGLAWVVGRKLADEDMGWWATAIVCGLYGLVSIVGINYHITLGERMKVELRRKDEVLADRIRLTAAYTGYDIEE